jgi:hypothetical protein
LNPETMSRQVLAASASGPLLSPDRRLLAYVENQAASLIAFVQADGKKSTYVRWSGDGVVRVVGWMNNDTVALLGLTPKAPSAQSRPASSDERLKNASVFFLRSDGTLLPRRIDLPPDRELPGDVAISPDGRRVAACFPQRLVFLDSEGKQRGEAHVPPPGESKKDELPYAFAQPTFAPDGKSLAVKLMTNDGAYRTTAVVFFSPDGKELSRVAIPKIAVGTTRPASAPASAPAQP